MYKRVLLIVAVTLFLAVEVQAARRGRGGCANGQCGIQTTYVQADAKVAAIAPAPRTSAVAQASANQPVDAVSTTTVETQQVAIQPARRGIFRRWSR